MRKFRRSFRDFWNAFCRWGPADGPSMGAVRECAVEAILTDGTEFLGTVVAVTAEADRLPHVSDVERMIGDLLQVVREELRLEVVFLGEFVDGRRIFRHISAEQLPEGLQLGGSHSLEDTICQRIVDGRMPSVLDSVARVRASYGLSSAYDSLGAHVGVPVMFTDGSLYGVLCGFSFEAREDLSERDVRRLEMAANAAGRFLAQADGHDVNRPLVPWN